MRRRYRVPFGRHRGTPLDELEDGYFWWLHDRDNLREPLRSALDAEARRRRLNNEREEKPTPDLERDLPEAAVCEELLAAGYRSLAMKHHPDRGGDHERMQQINAAAEWLRKQLRRIAA